MARKAATRSSATAADPLSPFVQTAIEYAKAAVADRKRRDFCELVRLTAKRFLNDLKRAKRRDCPFYFSEWHADDVCDFIEKMPHVQGSWDSATLTLEPAQIFILVRSEERRVGKEGVGTCISRWSPSH